MIDTIEDIEPPYRSGDSDKVNRQFQNTSEDILINDISLMLHDMLNVPCVISDYAKMIIERVRRG